MKKHGIGNVSQSKGKPLRKQVTADSNGSGSVSSLPQPPVKVGTAKPKKRKLDAGDDGSQDPNKKNVLDIKYLTKVNKLKKTISGWDHMFDADNDDVESRISQMIRVEVIGQSLCEKYSWVRFYSHSTALSF
jgi:hypothetical protein